MSAGLASGLEIGARIIRDHQGKSVDECFMSLSARADQAKKAFEIDNSVYTYGVCLGLGYSIVSFSDLVAGMESTYKPKVLPAESRYSREPYPDPAPWP